METKTIRNLKKGEFFRLSDRATAPVWVRGEYVREVKKYSAYKYDDINHERLLPGDKEVFIGFTF
jgi:hypothetical protein